jgi:hypothetical protein
MINNSYTESRPIQYSYSTQEDTGFTLREFNRIKMQGRKVKGSAGPLATDP